MGDTSKFGKDGAKTLNEELVKGEAQLTRKPDGSIIRLVDVVILRITRSDGDSVVEISGVAGQSGRLPAVKRRPDENPFWAAKRVLSKVLKISENLVNIDRNNVLLIEEETTSKAYVGLPTIYRRLVISAQVVED